MNKHEKALNRLLTEPYVPKTVIRDAIKCSNEKANEIFDKAKEIENKKTLIDPRPTQVQSQSVFKVTGLNYSFVKKQFENKSI